MLDHPTQDLLRRLELDSMAFRGFCGPTGSTVPVSLHSAANRRTAPLTWVTTDSTHAFNIAPNLLNRDFHADIPNQKWAGDISYVWTREGWHYLSVTLGLHSRRVIGRAVRNRMKRD